MAGSRTSREPSVSACRGPQAAITRGCGGGFSMARVAPTLLKQHLSVKRSVQITSHSRPHRDCLRTATAPSETRSDEARKPSVCSPPEHSRRSCSEPWLALLARTPSLRFARDESCFTSFGRTLKHSLHSRFEPLLRCAQQDTERLASLVFRAVRSLCSRRHRSYAHPADSLTRYARSVVPRATAQRYTARVDR